MRTERGKRASEDKSLTPDDPQGRPFSRRIRGLGASNTHLGPSQHKGAPAPPAGERNRRAAVPPASKPCCPPPAVQTSSVAPSDMRVRTSRAAALNRTRRQRPRNSSGEQRTRNRVSGSAGLKTPDSESGPARELPSGGGGTRASASLGVFTVRGYSVDDRAPVTVRRRPCASRRPWASDGRRQATGGGAVFSPASRTGGASSPHRAGGRERRRPALPRCATSPRIRHR